MTETQEKFIYVMEHSNVGKEMPYEMFCKVFADSTFDMQDLYDMFAMGLHFNEVFKNFKSSEEIEQEKHDAELSTHVCGRFCDDVGDCPFTQCTHNKNHHDEDY